MSARLPTKQELADTSGTPDQFALAVWMAHTDLFVTTAEAICAIQEYRYEFQQAKE